MGRKERKRERRVMRFLKNDGSILFPGGKDVVDE